jgi:VIT1/CCC1 family predicted Fe2+/Mn2+ transporter
MVEGAAGSIIEWVRPQVPEASDGILTSAGICEGFAGAGVSSGVLIFAGFAALVAGTLAMGAVEYFQATCRARSAGGPAGQGAGPARDRARCGTR